MASPSVETVATTAETANTTSHAITLASGITAGDLLIVIFACDGAPTITMDAAYSEIKNLAHSGSGHSVAVAYRQATGDVNDDCTIGTSISERSATVHYRISGHIAPATQVPEISAVADGSSTDPDPDGVTPTGGSKDYLFLAFVASGLGGETWTAAPTNYGNIQSSNSTGSGAGASLGTAERALTASTENPGVFTETSTGDWLAGTIAVHPVAAAAAVVIQRRVRIGH